jgi:hypothetical protein
MDCSSFSNSSVRVKGRVDEVLAREVILDEAIWNTVYGI